MTATELPVRRRWRPKSLAGKTALTLFLAVIFVAIVWLIALVLTERRVAAAVAKARELGQGRTWEELLGSPLPDAENAAVPLRDAGLLAEKVMIGLEAKEKNTSATQRGDVYAGAAKRLLADANYERLLREADARRRYRTLNDFSSYEALNHTLSDNTVRLEYLAPIEAAAAEELARQGRPTASLARLVRLLRLTRKVRTGEPTLSCNMIALHSLWAVLDGLHHLMCAGRLPAHEWDAVVDELGRHDRLLADSAVAWDGDRLLIPKAMADLTLHRSPLLRPFAKVDLAFMHECMNAYAGGTDELQSPAATRLQLEHPFGNPPTNAAIGNFAGAPLFGRYWTINVVFNLEACQNTLFRATAQVRCLRTLAAMAVEDGFDRKQVESRLPAAARIDPFDGKPLRIKQTPAGPIVYSVGFNVGDDGGDIAEPDERDIGYGPREKEPQ